MKAPFGRIRTMTTIARAGNITRDIGIARITITDTGRNVAMGGGIATTTTMIMIAATTITTGIRSSLVN